MPTLADAPEYIPPPHDWRTRLAELTGGDEVSAESSDLPAKRKRTGTADDKASMGEDASSAPPAAVMPSPPVPTAQLQTELGNVYRCYNKILLIARDVERKAHPDAPKALEQALTDFERLVKALRDGIRSKLPQQLRLQVARSLDQQCRALHVAVGKMSSTVREAGALIAGNAADVALGGGGGGGAASMGN